MTPVEIFLVLMVSVGVAAGDCCVFIIAKQLSMAIMKEKTTMWPDEIKNAGDMVGYAAAAIFAFICVIGAVCMRYLL